MDKVATTVGGGPGVRSDLYLGFGPILPPSKKEGRSVIEVRKAVSTEAMGAGELSLAYPESIQAELRVEETFLLLNWFGTVGSRSRNGWGAVGLNEASDDVVAEIRDAARAPTPLWAQVTRPWEESLGPAGCEWPHAIGTDAGRPLIWVSEPLAEWPKAMGLLANLKVAVRRAAKQMKGPHGVGGIHLLGYPAGGVWNFQDVDKDARLGSQLRFKVVPAGAGKVAAMAFHMPSRVPEAFLDKLGPPARAAWIREHEREVWHRVHRVLDDHDKVERIV